MTFFLWPAFGLQRKYFNNAPKEKKKTKATFNIYVYIYICIYEKTVINFCVNTLRSFLSFVCLFTFLQFCGCLINLTPPHHQTEHFSLHSLLLLMLCVCVSVCLSGWLAGCLCVCAEDNI